MTESGELGKEPRGEGVHIRMDCCDAWCASANDDTEIEWHVESNKYGLLGCSLQRSTKPRRLSLVTSKGCGDGGSGDAST
jgi:hypothetical protein